MGMKSHIAGSIGAAEKMVKAKTVCDDVIVGLGLKKGHQMLRRKMIRNAVLTAIAVAVLKNREKKVLTKRKSVVTVTVVAMVLMGEMRNDLNESTKAVAARIKKVQ